MQLYQAFILSLVQAATEFLPVSSSGHLLFLKGLFHIEEMPIIFDIVIHVGSLVAILFFYRQRIIHTLRDAFQEIGKKQPEKSNIRFLFYIIISTIITFVLYMLFDDAIESRYQDPSILFVTFLFTSILLFLTRFIKGRSQSLKNKKNLLVPVLAGLFQGFAIMPGVSRSGSTISSLLFMNIKKEDAAFYSFFLAIPAILGALVFQIADLENLSFLKEEFVLVFMSFIVTTIGSYFFLFCLTWVLNKGKFWYFSIYTLGMAILSKILFT